MATLTLRLPHLTEGWGYSDDYCLGGITMKHIAVTTVACLSLAGAAGAAAVSDLFSSYLAFGDSLTDNGKFGADTLGPPSDRGRFSNGPTYAELLAKDFTDVSKFSTNFALGGATAELDNETPYPDPAAAAPFATFSAQVGSLTGFLSTPPSAFLGDDPLVSVLFGANDLLQDLGDSPTVGADAADAVKSGIEAIAALDGKFDDFLVINLPALSETPRFKNGPFEGLAKATTDQFNAQLKSNVEDLRSAGLKIVEFDLASVFEMIADDPNAFGITNILEPCTQSFTDFTPEDNCAFDPRTGDITLAAADDFLFTDSIHPNRLAHEALAEQIRETFDPSPVPLPAGLPLLLAGLGAFGIVRMRKTNES